MSLGMISADFVIDKGFSRKPCTPHGFYPENNRAPNERDRIYNGWWKIRSVNGWNEELYVYGMHVVWS
uniref:Anaphase-promoting complex subunit 1 n=1 Tax=Mesocestoides corti TaxID=53468 RepID=A0A5K3FZG2_MESCO